MSGINPFAAVINDIILAEVGPVRPGKDAGGYTNDPTDRGGPTRWGVTQAVAREQGYMGDMAAYPRAKAEEVYTARYITRPGFNRVYEIDPALGFELIDTGVNMGATVAGMFFQRWLNAFNFDGSGYADLHVDGSVGNLSIIALNAFIKKRGEEGRKVLLTALNCSQGARYLDITEKSQTQRRFIYGWVKERVKI